MIRPDDVDTSENMHETRHMLGPGSPRSPRSPRGIELSPIYDVENSWRRHVHTKLEDWYNLEGVHPEDHEARSTMFARSLPLLIAVCIGLCTASTALYNGVCSEFIADARNGVCWSDLNGPYAMDQARCCGGKENINFKTGDCKETHQGAELDGLTTHVTWQEWTEFPGMAGNGMLIYVALSVVFGTTSAYLTTIAPSAKGSGIPEVKAAVSGYALPAPFSAETLVIKCVALAFSVGAGMALGKEGPLIQIGACWGTVMSQVVSRMFGVEPLPKHVLYSIGAAAGVCTAFGAPIGGVLFVVEELSCMRMTSMSRNVLLLCFCSSICAAYLLKYINLSGMNRLTMFQAESESEWFWYEAGLFVLLGIAGGLIGAAFINCNVYVSKLRKKHAPAGRVYFIPKCLYMFVPKCLQVQNFALVAEIFFVSLITGITNYPITAYLRHGPNAVIVSLFQSCPHDRLDTFDLCDEKGGIHGYSVGFSVLVELMLACCIRVCQATITFGSMVPAGLFIPSLLPGAAMGRAAGHMLLGMGFHSASPPLYAMVGAAAMLSGFTQLTVSLVVILFELTGHLNAVLPFMFATMSARVVCRIFTTSIYDRHGHMQQFVDVEESEEIRFHVSAGDVAKPCRPMWAEPVLLADLLDWCREPVDVVGPNNSLVPAELLRAHVIEVAKTTPSDAVCAFAKGGSRDVDFSHLCIPGFTTILDDTPVHTIYCMFAEHRSLPGIFVGSPVTGVLSRAQLKEVLTECVVPVVLPKPSLGLTPRPPSFPGSDEERQRVFMSPRATKIGSEYETVQNDGVFE